ncbi:unnamed protein product [Phaeothamnion confervicola]
MVGKPLRELVGAVLYLAVTTRPEIFDQVRALTQCCHDPRRPDWLAALWLLRYLKGTREKGLLYSRSTAARVRTPAVAIGYADADWARGLDSRRSVGEYVFLRSGAAVSWRSQMQDCTAASTCEAEYVAAAYAVQHAPWLRLARGLGLIVTAPTPIHEDNQLCSDIATDLFSERRVKHIDINFHTVRERVESGEVILEPTKTKDQLADLLTKPLPAPRTPFLRELILGE